ncbi:MAG: YfhO family protein, partial [Fimbriimonadaceae bacterium]|nr:YfhO family protein [Chitinophagales bacterium]
QDASTSYHHKSIGGYNAAKLRRYQDVIENQFSRIDANGKSLGPNMEVLNMLNTKYLIVPDKNRQPVAQPNPNINGNAWFVDEIKWVNNADEEMAALNDLDSKATAVIDKRFEKDLPGFNPDIDSAATIILKSYEPNHVVYDSKTTLPSLAVFSEIYYQPGWKSFIDGKEMPHVRANYILRAMQVPAGDHTIEFKFRPETYYKGESISRISSLAVLLLSVAGIGWLVWQNRKKKTATN